MNEYTTRTGYPVRFFRSRTEYRVWLWAMFTVTVIIPLLAPCFTWSTGASHLVTP